MFPCIMPHNSENIEPPEDVIEAEIVDAEIVEAHTDGNSSTETVNKTPIFADEEIVDLSVQRLSAKGGAVGSVLLALLGLAGMALSSYSIFNVILALLFSIWGMNSPLRKTAIENQLGIFLF